MPTYGKVKVQTLTYDSSGSAVDLAVGDIAPKASPTFTGDVTLTGSSYNVVFDASDNALIFADNAKATFGTDSDLIVKHTGTAANIDNSTGDLLIRQLGSSGDIYLDPKSSQRGIKVIRDGAVELSHNGSTKIATSAAGVTVTGAVSDSKGDLRNIPINSRTAAYTLVVGDAGKVVGNTTGGWTIPAGVFTTVGQTVTLLNNSGSAQNITASALTYLYNTADGANIKASTIALGARAMATIWFDGGATGYIQSGALTVS